MAEGVRLEAKLLQTNGVSNLGLKMGGAVSMFGFPESGSNEQEHSWNHCPDMRSR